MISFFVTPTIGTMIFGAPAPISISLTLIVFIIVCLSFALLYCIVTIIKIILSGLTVRNY